jgi:hypothetical protein
VPGDVQLGGVDLFWQWALTGEAGFALTTTASQRTTVIGV